MRIFITGATGFLGSYVTEFLVSQGAEVAVLLRESSHPWRLEVVWSPIQKIIGDLSMISRWRKEVADFAPDTIIHLGWHGVAGSDRNDPQQIEQNLDSSIALVRLARECECSAFIGLGSQAEYGPCNRKVDETNCCMPTTLYGATKLSICHLGRVTLLGSPTRFTWLRLFSSYGPRDNPGWMIPSLINQLLEGKKPALTKCEQKWDYLYVEDAAEAICRVAFSPNTTGIFNLGSGLAVSLREVVELVRDAIDSRLPLGFGEVPYRPDQVMHLQADINHLQHEVLWQPTTSIAEGLKKTISFFRARMKENIAIGRG